MEESQPRSARRERRWATFIAGLSIAALFGVIAALSSARNGNAQAASPAVGVVLPEVPPLAEAEDKPEPGLMLWIEPANGPPAREFDDVRVTRMLALYVPAGSAASPFVAKGPFKATFEGDINMRLRDFLFFSAVGRGTLSLTLNGKPVLDLTGDFAQKPSESIRLNKGKNHIVAIYQAPGNGDAELRLFWATKTTLPEPLAPMVFTHSSADKRLRASARVREGRILIAQLRCTKCHGVSDIVGPNSTDAMPELAMDAPSLEEIGSRRGQGWMAAWISNPRALRPSAHMPRLFESKQAIAPEAQDIAAYLGTLGAAQALPAESGKAEAGGQLFASLNCIACHITPDRTGEGQPGVDEGRISLAHVKSKFAPGALKAFLLNPSAHYAWISMPNFRLTDEEAGNLAAWLRSIEGKPFGLTPAGDAGNGHRLVLTAGCINCHAIGPPQPAADKPALPVAFSAIGKEGWMRGCMAVDPAARNHAPDFNLTDAQRAAILAFAATDRLSLKQDAPAEFSRRQFAALRCFACHSRDGHESLLATDLDAENQDLHGRFPAPPQVNGEAMAPDQRAPILTWTGEKLRPEWLADFIAGKIAYKPRYYLRARMPGFGVRAGLLARGLIEEHGCTPACPPYGPPDKKLAGIGQTLVGKTPNQSFGCVQCHSIAQQPALAPFEAPAINFMHVTSRLRDDYYYRWIHDPLRIDPETKMPRFDDADGKTGVPVFDNDARRQFEAIWNYLLTGDGIAPPAQ